MAGSAIKIKYCGIREDGGGWGGGGRSVPRVGVARAQGWPWAGWGLDWEGLLRLPGCQSGLLRLLCFVHVFFELGTRDGELKVVCWMKGQSDSSNQWFQPVFFFFLFSGFRGTNT